MNAFTKFALATTLMTLTMGLAGCESDTDNSVEKARACLDKNTGAAAQQCESILYGKSGLEVDSLRVKIRFEYKNLIRGLAQNISGGLDAVTGAIIDTAGAASALETLNMALSSGNNGLILVARLSYIATLCDVSGTNAHNSASVLAGCNTLAAGAGDATLNAQLTALQGNACASPSDNTSTDPNNLCKKTKDALAANPANPAAAFSGYINAGN